MKITKTISINPEVWLKAQRKTDNVSGTIESLLDKWSEEAPDKDMSDREKLKNELEIKNLEVAKLKQEMEQIKKQEYESSKSVWIR